MTNPSPQNPVSGIVREGETELLDIVEAKVKTSTIAAAGSGLILSALSVYVFKGNVPDIVTILVDGAVIAAATYITGYLTRHTARVVPAPVTSPGSVTPPTTT